MTVAVLLGVFVLLIAGLMLVRHKRRGEMSRPSPDRRPRARIVRLCRVWFSPLQHFDHWAANVVLNLGGSSAIIVGFLFLTSKFGVWAGVALVILALLLLALAALWGLLPRQGIVIAFDKKDVQMVNATDQSGNVTGAARYFHFKVESPARVRNCRGRLVRVDVEHGGDFQRHPGFKPPEDLTLDSKQGLVWPEIEPDLPARINLVFTESSFPQVALLCVPDHSPHGNMTSLTPGTYRLTARVSADGVEDVEGSFIVTVTDNWDGLDVAIEQ